MNPIIKMNDALVNGSSNITKAVYTADHDVLVAGVDENLTGTLCEAIEPGTLHGGGYEIPNFNPPCICNGGTLYASETVLLSGALRACFSKHNQNCVKPKLNLPVITMYKT